jgi:hypothetical protein
MKYIVGASVGGLFGLGVPFMIDVNETYMNDDIARQEEFQPAEDEPQTPIDMSLTLSDTVCEYVSYKSEEPIEQAKECLKFSIPAIPAI